MFGVFTRLIVGYLSFEILFQLRFFRILWIIHRKIQIRQNYLEGSDKRNIFYSRPLLAQQFIDLKFPNFGSQKNMEPRLLESMSSLWIIIIYQKGRDPRESFRKNKSLKYRREKIIRSISYHRGWEKAIGTVEQESRFVCLRVHLFAINWFIRQSPLSELEQSSF